MSFYFLSSFKFHIGREKIVDIWSRFIPNIEADKGESTKPNNHCSLKGNIEEDQNLTYREHEDCPKEIEWEYSIEFPYTFVIEWVFKMIEVEEPKGRKEHKGYVDPSLCEGSEAENKLAYHFIYYEYDFSFGCPSGHYWTWSYPGLKKSHRHNRRDKDEDWGEKESDAWVYEVSSSEALNCREILKHLNTWVCLRRAAVNNIE